MYVSIKVLKPNSQQKCPTHCPKNICRYHTVPKIIWIWCRCNGMSLVSGLYTCKQKPNINRCIRFSRDSLIWCCENSDFFWDSVISTYTFGTVCGEERWPSYSRRRSILSILEHTVQHRVSEAVFTVVKAGLKLGSSLKAWFPNCPHQLENWSFQKAS